MTRIKHGVAARARHKRILKRAKGYRGRHRTVFKLAKQMTMRGERFAYRDRRVKKREKRSLWINHINAGVRAHGTTYSKFMAALSKKKISLDRKVLAQLAHEEPSVFAEIVKLAEAK